MKLSKILEKTLNEEMPTGHKHALFDIKTEGKQITIRPMNRYGETVGKDLILPDKNNINKEVLKNYLIKNNAFREVKDQKGLIDQKGNNFLDDIISRLKNADKIMPNKTQSLNHPADLLMQYNIVKDTFEIKVWKPLEQE